MNGQGGRPPIRPSAPPGPPQQAPPLPPPLQQQLPPEMQQQQFLRSVQEHIDARVREALEHQAAQHQNEIRAAIRAAQFANNEAAPPRPERFRWPTATLTYGGATDRESAAQKWIQFRKLIVGFMAVMNPGQPQRYVKQALANCITGAAQEAVQDLDYMTTDAAVTFEGMLDAYEKRLCPMSSKTIAQAEFRQARQGPNEGSLEFFGRLRGYYTRAFPTPGSGATFQELYEAFLMEALLNGLRRDDMRRNLYSKGCETLDELLKEVAHEESARVSTSVRAGLHRLIPTGVRANTATRGIEPMEVAAVNASSTSNGSCFNCGKAGHLARQCPHRGTRSNDNSARGNTSGSGGKTATGRPAASTGSKKPLRRWRFAPKMLTKIQQMLGDVSPESEEAQAIMCALQDAVESDDIEYYDEDPVEGLNTGIAAVIAESDEAEEDFQLAD